MREIQAELVKSIVSALYRAEEAGDIVICTGAPHGVAELISEEVRSVFTGELFTPQELHWLSSLISSVVLNKQFCNIQFPTLSGCRPEEMQALGEKIRALTTYW